MNEGFTMGTPQEKTSILTVLKDSLVENNNELSRKLRFLESKAEYLDGYERGEDLDDSSEMSGFSGLLISEVNRYRYLLSRLEEVNQRLDTII